VPAASKEDKDRLVPLAHVAVESLRAHRERIRAVYGSDRRAGVAGVWLPEGLERKYPRAGEEWPWYWLCLEDHVSVDPWSGLCRRHHVPEALRRVWRVLGWCDATERQTVALIWRQMAVGLGRPVSVSGSAGLSIRLRAA
jgi:hypothetical protein